MKLELLLVICKGRKIISQLDEKKYPVEIRRDDDNGKNFFVARQHCRIEGYEKFFIPAFKIIVDNGDEPANYTLAISADKNDITPEKLTQDDNLFFQLDREKDSEHSDGEQIKNLGFEPGVSYIFVLKNGEIFGNPHKIFIMPSSMTEKEFIAMINEMLYIRSELISRHTKSIVGLPIEIKKDSQKFFQYLQKQIEELCKVMKKINLRPRQKLSKIPITCKVEKLRKFDSKIMRQYLANPQRKNYLVDGNEVSLNIFENRFLLNKLHELQKKIVANAKINNNNFGSEHKSILRKISSEVATKISDTKMAIEELQKKSGELEEKLNVLNQKFDNSLKIKHQPLDIPEQTITIVFHQINDPKLCLDNGIKIIFEPVWKDYSNRGRNLSGTFFRICSEKTLQEECSWGYWEELIFFTDNVRNQATLAAFILRNSSDSETTISLKGQFEFENGRYNNSKKIKIYSLKNMTLDGKTHLKSEEDTVQFLKNLSAEYENLEIERKKIENLKINLESNLQNLQSNSQSKNLVEKLEDILHLPMFDTVKNKIERWRMTQIFTNDANYHRAYKILKHLDDILNSSFQANEKNILSKNLDKIYEYWILAKIIEHLVLKLNFKVDGGEDVVKIFNDFFDSYEQKTNSSACINLSRQDITIKFFYDTPIDQIFKNTTRKFKPDYFFIVRKNNSLENIFILDAKYRDYETMEISYWLTKNERVYGKIKDKGDLKGVCLNKYVNEIFKALHKKTAMSFVVHSDRTHNAKDYLGKYVVFNGTVDSRCNFLNEDGKIIEDGSKQQFGSFYLLPNTDDDEINRSEEHLTLFFEMMFEYFMDDWQENCWQCGASGSENISVQELLTAGGHPKYHMTCKKCGAFWVKNHCHNCHKKLIKHLTNYHVDKNKEKWYVLCPKCGK